MCAIGGMYSLDVNQLQIDHRKILKTMRHRGPDGEFHCSLENIHLYHSRLSILDLDDRSKQPFFSRSKNTVITFNGEIYNYQNLKKELSVPLRTTSDTEVLVEFLEKKNVSALPELDGMFSFASYDINQRQLLLAVDPAGKKPMYTYYDGEIFAFASEIKTLAAMGLPIIPSQDAKFDFLFFGYSPTPQSFYKNIRKLPAGHYQIVLDGKPQKIQAYFELPRETRSISYAEAQEKLVALTTEATRKRLVSDRPLGCFLSGGLDSSIISLEASRLLSTPLKTFSIAFRQSPDAANYDESYYAERVSHLLKSEHTAFEMNSSVEELNQLIRHFDEPFSDSSSFPMALLCKNTSEQIKVVLSGDGGDELFGGYLRFKASLWAERFSPLTPLLEVFSGIPISSKAWRDKIKRFQTAAHEKSLQRLALWSSFYSFQDIAALSKEAEERIRQGLSEWDEKLRGLTLKEKILHFNFHHYLQNDLLVKVDRMSMLYGIEVRSPFLDKALIRFAFELPSHFKFNYCETKKILKDAYRGSLTPEIVDRRKKGFGFPLEIFMREKGNLVKDSKYLPLTTNSSKEFALLCLSKFQDIR